MAYIKVGDKHVGDFIFWCCWQNKDVCDFFKMLMTILLVTNIIRLQNTMLVTNLNVGDIKTHFGDMSCQRYPYCWKTYFVFKIRHQHRSGRYWASRGWSSHCSSTSLTLIRVFWDHHRACFLEKKSRFLAGDVTVGI